MRIVAWLVTVAGAVAVCAVTSTARAAASARLVYLRGPGAEECPAEGALRAAVAARLGYDPFFAWANETLYVEITRGADTFRAAIKLVGADNRMLGGRDLAVRVKDCSAVIDAMALTVSLTIDPSSVTGLPSPSPPPSSAPPTPAAPASPPEPTPAAPTPPQADEPPPTAPTTGVEPVQGRVALGALGAAGVGPSLSMGGILSAGVVWRRVSLDLEGRVDTPSSGSGDIPDVQVTTWLAMGALVPCVRAGIAFFCGVGAVGSLRATSSGTAVYHSFDTDALWVGAGGRAGVELALAGPWSLRAHGEVLANLSRAHLTVNDSPPRGVYDVPPASGSAGAAIVWRFR